MTKNQIVIRPASSSVYRRQPLLDSSVSSSSRRRIVEVAGGTAAECAAVWCCGPCTVVNLLVLAVYKLPAGICRKALRKRKRRRMMEKGLLPLPSSATSSCHGSCQCSWDPTEFHQFQLELGQVPENEELAKVVVVGGNEVDQDLIELEKEMWKRFYSAGFWRSPSQRED